MLKILYLCNNYQTWQVTLQFDRVLTTTLRTLLRLKIPCSLPTPYIFTAPFESEAHLESIRTSAVELSGGNGRRLQAVGYFRQRAPLWMFDRILNATLSNNSLYSSQKIREPSITGVTKRNLGLTLLPNSLDLHQTQNQKLNYA